MNISVSGTVFTFPQACVCCGRAPDSYTFASASRSRGKRVVRTETRSWRFPICSACLRHASAWSSTRHWVTAGWISGFVLFFCLVAASAAAGFACLLTLVVVGYIARARARKNVVERDCSSSCACAGHPVAFMGWDGSVSSFYFVQRGYAADFLISNSAKAINLTPDARAVLDAHLYAKVAESRMAAAAAQAEVHALRERQAVEAEHRRIEQERHREESGYQLAVSKLESARGPAGRRAALDAGLRAVRQPHLREQLLIEASKVEAEAALEKAESQKSPAAKRRTLETALEALRNDPVPDELQAKQIEQLEDALAALDAGTMAAG